MNRPPNSYHATVAFKDSPTSSRSGSTMIQAKDPTTQSAAATKNGVPQPKYLASQGVREAVMAPPIWLPIFITPETEPAERPAMSEVTDQNALCERYKAPAPPASTMLASRASSARVPKTIKAPHRAMLTAATPQRPVRFPRCFVSRSLIHPPSGEQIAIAMKGSIP